MQKKTLTLNNKKRKHAKKTHHKNGVTGLFLYIINVWEINIYKLIKHFFQDTLSQLSGYNVPTLPATTEPCTLGDIRSAVDNLRQCWQQVEGQIDDKDRHLQHLLQFQHLYHSALLTVSGWLDQAESQLMEAGLGKDLPEYLAECQAIQDDMEQVWMEFVFTVNVITKNIVLDICDIVYFIWWNMVEYESPGIFSSYLQNVHIFYSLKQSFISFCCCRYNPSWVLSTPCVKNSKLRPRQRMRAWSSRQFRSSPTEWRYWSRRQHRGSSRYGKNRSMLTVVFLLKWSLVFKDASNLKWYGCYTALERNAHYRRHYFAEFLWWTSHLLSHKIMWYLTNNQTFHCRRRAEAEAAVSTIQNQLGDAKETLADLEESRAPVDAQVEQVKQVRQSLGDCDDRLGYLTRHGGGEGFIYHRRALFISDCISGSHTISSWFLILDVTSNQIVVLVDLCNFDMLVLLWSCDITSKFKVYITILKLMEL